VSSFQQEATAKSSEAETAKTKLATVRKMIAKLLKSINEEFDIDPECDTEQVDELLAACVKQAVQDQTQESQDASIAEAQETTATQESSTGKSVQDATVVENNIDGKTPDSAKNGTVEETAGAEAAS